jgi:hypothetical protein
MEKLYFQIAHCDTSGLQKFLILHLTKIEDTKISPR